MSRVHDMGGRFGDGAVAPGEDAVFAAPWHGRALALTLAAGALGHWTIDASRHARESLSPRDYARFSYYEKWLAALADMLRAYEEEYLTCFVTPGGVPHSSPLEL